MTIHLSVFCAFTRGSWTGALMDMLLLSYVLWSDLQNILRYSHNRWSMESLDTAGETRLKRLHRETSGRLPDQVPGASELTPSQMRELQFLQLLFLPMRVSSDTLWTRIISATCISNLFLSVSTQSSWLPVRVEHWLVGKLGVLIWGSAISLPWRFLMMQARPQKRLTCERDNWCTWTCPLLTKTHRATLVAEYTAVMWGHTLHFHLQPMTKLQANSEVPAIFITASRKKPSGYKSSPIVYNLMRKWPYPSLVYHPCEQFLNEFMISIASYKYSSTKWCSFCKIMSPLKANMKNDI